MGSARHNRCIIACMSYRLPLRLLLAALLLTLTAPIAAAAVPESIAEPSLSGQAADGQTLTVTDGLWSNLPDSFSYQWQSRDTDSDTWADLGGAITDSFTIGYSQIGDQIRACVSATNGDGTSIPACTNPRKPPRNTVMPLVTGDVVFGGTLTIDYGTWLNTPISWEFYWFRDSNYVNGADSSTYELTAADRGKEITVLIVGINADGAGKQIASNAVTLANLPVNTIAPAIAAGGKVAADQVLTAETGSWTNSPTGYAYQWQTREADGDNWIDISTATAATYAVSALDLSNQIRVCQTATNAGGTTDATCSVELVPPRIAAAPWISGTNAVGASVSVSNGIWLNTPTGYDYQWLRAGQPIEGATTNTYVVTVADQGATLTVRVTARNADGTTPTTTGNSLAVPSPQSPVVTPTPDTSGPTTPAPTTGDTTPGQPAGAKASVGKGKARGKVTVSWRAAAQAASYRIVFTRGKKIITRTTTNLKLIVKPGVGRWQIAIYGVNASGTSGAAAKLAVRVR